MAKFICERKTFQNGRTYEEGEIVEAKKCPPHFVDPKKTKKNSPPPPPLPELNEKHEEWENLKLSLVKEEITIAKIKEKFQLSPEDEEKLKEAKPFEGNQ